MVERVQHLIGKLSEGIKLDILKTFASTAANGIVLPTPVGVPLSLNLSLSAVVRLEGHIKAKNLPTLQELIRRPFDIRKFEIEGSIKPRYATNTIFFV